ncbi:MAG TPA: DUF2070 family protein [Candidatus Norongarragalinales archaeon]|jgi:putative membrane protein|nr:DUF2070 family protein [Candidatus Norongarragalinales archaeon]
MASSLRESTTGLTRFIFKLPSANRTIVYLAVFGFLAGIALSFLFDPRQSLIDILLFGGIQGVLVLSLPAMCAALLATTGLERTHFKWAFKYFIFLALITAAVAAVGYGAGIFATKITGTSFILPALLVNAALVLVWFVGAYVALGYNAARALPVSFVQPALNIAALVFWRGFGIVSPPSPTLLALELAVAATIFLAGLWLLFYILNAPAKRNLGVNAIQAATLFSAQWIKGSKGLEEVMAEMGEKVETFVSAVAFENAKGKNKAFFLVPHVHYGPVGNMGGSEWPHLLSKIFQEKHDCPALVFKGTAGHDYNPVYSSDAQMIARELEQCLKQATRKTSNASFIKGNAGPCEAFGLEFDNKSFVSISRAPEHTDDIDAALGVALRNAILAKGFNDSTIIDRHNSAFEVPSMAAGSEEFFQALDSVNALTQQQKGRIELGIATDPLKQFTASQGIGKAGLKIAVLQIGKARACMVLLDANNSTPQFRESVLQRLKKFRFTHCDIFTTDTHAVNSISGVHNPLGSQPNSHALVNVIEETVAKALRDVEPVRVGMGTRRVKIDVMGSRRSSELLSTVGAIVSVAKIVAPAMFLAALALALLSIVVIF